MANVVRRSKILIRTAVKYTERGSIVVEALDREENEANPDSHTVSIEIVIADTGCGIEPSRLQGMFREFEQVELEAPKRAGTIPQFGEFAVPSVA